MLMLFGLSMLSPYESTSQNKSYSTVRSSGCSSCQNKSYSITENRGCTDVSRYNS